MARTGPGRWVSLASALLVLAAAVLPYLNTLGNGFVLDDILVVRDNPLIVSLRGIPRLFAENYWAPVDRANLYRPVTVASYAVNRALTGADPWGFHLGNVILHAAVCLLLLRLLGALGLPVAAATVAAALFAVHPLHAEAVAGVVGRADLLAALGTLGALWLHTVNAAERFWRRAAGAALLLALGLLAKEVAIGALVPILAFDLARRRRRAGKIDIRPYVLYAVVIAAYGLTRIAVLGGDKAAATPGLTRIDNSLAGEAIAPRLLTAGAVLSRYLALAVYPRVLSADYSYDQLPVARSLLDPWVAGGILAALAAAAGLAAAWRRGAPATAAALALLAGPYLVVSNAAVLIGSLMAERLFYLPSAGLAVLLGLVLARLPASRRAIAALAAAAAVVGGALALRTAVRNRDWKDPRTLFEATARTSPRSIRAQVYLAQARAGDGDFDGARAALEAALRIDPEQAWTWDQWAHLQQARDPAEAERALRRAIALDPESSLARYDLGWLLATSGRFEAALPELRRAVELRPYNPHAWIGLAWAYVGLGRPAEARPWAEKALDVLPGDAFSHETLGHLLEMERQPDEAAAAYERALAIDPRLASAAQSLGRLHERAGRADAALVAYRRAWEGRQPPPASFLRAAAILAGAGRFDEADQVLDAARRRLGASAAIEGRQGAIALARGDPEAARAAWLRALAIDPADAFARAQLAALEGTER